jgi:hypothetical protein
MAARQRAAWWSGPHRSRLRFGVRPPVFRVLHRCEVRCPSAVPRHGVGARCSPGVQPLQGFAPTEPGTCASTRPPPMSFPVVGSPPLGRSGADPQQRLSGVSLSPAADGPACAGHLPS